MSVIFFIFRHLVWLLILINLTGSLMYIMVLHLRPIVTLQQVTLSFSFLFFVPVEG